MPNHVHNDLWIFGPAEEVNELLAHIGADKPQPDFDFNALIPYPETWAQMDADRERVHKAFGNREKYLSALAEFEAKWHTDQNGYNSGGYEWCVEHWGTKWPAYNVCRRDYGGDVCVTFQTAWSPPRQIIAELHRQFPRCGLSLEFFERGSGFSGGVTYRSLDDWEDYREDEDDEFVAGVPAIEWRSNEYGGQRGG